jgi:DNA-binding MarR family transcriptional regulator
MKSSWFTETDVYLMHEIVGRLDRWAQKHVLDARGLSYGEFLIAVAVREMEQPTHGEVGERLDMSKSLVSQRVSTLLTKGIVTQHRDSQNRRQARLNLTGRGEEALEKICQELADSASRVFDVLGSARPQFLASLRRLRAVLRGLDAEDAASVSQN